MWKTSLITVNPSKIILLSFLFVAHFLCLSLTQTILTCYRSLNMTANVLCVVYSNRGSTDHYGDPLHRHMPVESSGYLEWWSGWKPHKSLGDLRLTQTPQNFSEEENLSLITFAPIVSFHRRTHKKGLLYVRNISYLFMTYQNLNFVLLKRYYFPLFIKST